MEHREQGQNSSRTRHSLEVCRQYRAQRAFLSASTRSTLRFCTDDRALRGNRRNRIGHGLRRGTHPGAAGGRPRQHPLPRRARRPVPRHRGRTPAHPARRPHGASGRGRRPGVPRPARPRTRVDPDRRRRRGGRRAPARYVRDRAGVGGRRRARHRHGGAGGVDVGAPRPARAHPRERRGARHQHHHLLDRDQGVLRLGVPRRGDARRDRRGSHRTPADRRTDELPRARRAGATLPSAVATRVQRLIDAGVIKISAVEAAGSRIDSSRWAWA